MTNSIEKRCDIIFVMGRGFSKCIYPIIARLRIVFRLCYCSRSLRSWFLVCRFRSSI